jgi:hypothetical protein
MKGDEREEFLAKSKNTGTIVTSKMGEAQETFDDAKAIEVAVQEDLKRAKGRVDVHLR